jgi:flagellar M-ring protein FliF
MASNSGFSLNKPGLVIGLVGLLACMAFGAWWLLQPSWQPILNSTDSPHSRVEIRNKLMEWGTVFKEDPANGNILVRDSELLGLRAKLGEQGIPEEPAPGLEIFSDAEYGMSEFTQRINYQRAIEAEIANTIRSFADVNSARVHLTIPKQSIFRDEKAIPKASVTIKPRPGQELSPNQISGIAQLVAASVDGLEAKNVIVLNNSGEVISAGQDDVKADLKQSKFDLENYYTSKARELVRGIANTDDLKISVNVVYNFDKVKAVREQVLPKSSGEYGHLQRVKRHTIKNSGENTADLSTTNSTEEEFLFSKERSEIEYSPGEIEKLSVGIVILRELPQQTIDNVISVVSSGLGMDLNRGDTIAVVAIPAEKAPAQQDNAISEKQQNPATALPKNIPVDVTISNSSQLILLACMVVIFILCITFAMVRIRKKHGTTTPRLSKHEQEALLLDLKTWLSKTSSGKSDA